MHRKLIKKLPDLVAAAIPGHARDKPIELWWQEFAMEAAIGPRPMADARVGQQGSLTYVWAPKGSRPRAPRDQRHSWAYLFGAVCPARGVGAALVLPGVNIKAMNLHLAEISTQITPFVGEMIHRIIPLSSSPHAVVTLDGAGWHRPGGALDVPANISLLPLPPYSPELNPVENIWQYLRQNYLTNRVFEGYTTIVDACCDAWNALVAKPDKIRSIATREWAQAVSA